MKKNTLVIVALLLFLIRPDSSFAQSSLVPSYHPVYEWLYIQRVKGLLLSYDYESLPLSRATILNHLKDLEQKISSGKEKKTLESFRQEFDPTHLRKQNTHSLFEYGERMSFDRFKNWAWSDNEKHLFSLTQEDRFLILDHGFGRKSFFVNDDGNSRTAPYIIDQHWRTYGDYKGFLGYHAELKRAVPVGDQRIFEYDGFYGYNRKFLKRQQNINFHYEGYVTASSSIFELSIGRGNLKEGVGQTENLLFSRSSIPTDWVKLKIGGERISYKFIHGKLSWQSVIRPLEGDSTINTKNSPERWYTYHKVSVKPFSWMKISASEMINYANRGVEIAYINPINRYAFAEWSLYDQDNGWFGGSIIVQPFKGAELYSEILLDDLGNKRDLLFKKKFPKNSRFGRRYGASLATNNGLLFWSEYTRIDPFVYAHFYTLNTHTDKGIGLGSQIGPNGDRLEAGVKLWGQGRSFINASYSYNRQGLDRFDENGNKVFLAGASVLDNRAEDVDKTHLFLDGDLHEWHRFLVQGSYEPKRGYIFTVNFDFRSMIKGDQIGDLRIFWADFVIGL